MKPSDYKISLDIHELQSQYSLPMKKGDTARVIYITLREGGVPYEIGKDCFAILSGKKPDGTVLENNCVISGNTIIYEITPQTTAASGCVDCEIKIYGADNGLICSPRFSIVVDERVVGEEVIESTSEFTALTKLYGDTNIAIKEAESSAQKANDIADTLQTKLDNGDFKGEKGDTPATDQTYNPTSENAQSGIAVAQACAEQKRAIHYEYWDISKTEDTTLFDKTYLLATPTTFEDAKASHNNFFTLLIKVKPNTTYYGFNEYANSQVAGRFAGMFQFFDENKNFLSKTTNPVDTITTPDDCYYIAMHNTYVDIAKMTTGEYWFTDKDADNRKDIIVLGDKLDLSQTNIEAGKGININGNVVSVEESSYEKEIKLKNFPTLPYKVYKNIFGEYLVEDIFTKKAINCQTYYVDCENGLDTNNGLTRETAFKTLKQGLSKYLTTNLGAFDGCIIKIIGDAPVFYYSDLYGETGLKNGNLFIVAENEVKIICGEKLTFTKHNTYENVFVSGTLTNTNVTYCLNIAENNKDSFGLYKPMTKVDSVETVNTTPNSYFIENNIVYSSVDTTVTLINSYNYWRFNHSTATSDTILYEENLNVIGGTYYSARSVKETDERVFETVFKNCKYQHNIMGNGVPIPNYDACYMIDVTAGYSKNDIFNYKANAITDDKLFDTVVVEVNCKGEEAGYYNTTIDGNTNISTAHEGLSILRLNTIGQHSAGPLIADVNGCRTICIGCDVLNLKYSYTPSSTNGCYVFNDVSAVKEGVVTLINCHGYDNRNNFKTLKSLCKTEIRNCDFHDSFECEDLSLFAD